MQVYNCNINILPIMFKAESAFFELGVLLKSFHHEYFDSWDPEMPITTSNCEIIHWACIPDFQYSSFAIDRFCCCCFDIIENYLQFKYMRIQQLLFLLIFLKPFKTRHETPTARTVNVHSSAQRLEIINAKHLTEAILHSKQNTMRWPN